jgi:ATP-binding protein involved in chromosome partitioning
MKELPNAQAAPKAKPQVTHQQPIASQNLAHVKHVIAVSSGKGGVGKSTVSTNLALALSALGFKVGLMDADVYGPSVPKMMGSHESPIEESGQMRPLDRHGLKFMSMGLLTDANTPVIWRGPMATRLIQHFLSNVAWGELDYLLIDLPPGTGDVQLTLTQAAPLRGAVVVTTPQEVAVDITMRGINMFDEVRVPIMGVIENMSGFVCSHCNHTTDIFKKGGGEHTAHHLGLPFLGAIPLDPNISTAGDAGDPIVHKDPTHSVSKSFFAIAEKIVKHAHVIEMQTAENNDSPTEIGSDEAHVLLKWKNGHESKFRSKKLRYLCPCASCVSEVSGKRMIKEEQVPEHIHPTGFRPIGRYGLQISWSDGHATGIYTFNYLKNVEKDCA